MIRQHTGMARCKGRLDAAGNARPVELLRMDRRPALDAVGRGRDRVGGALGAGGGRRRKLGDQPFQSREETSKYTDLMPDGKARQFTFVMEAKSVITRPAGGQQLHGPGFHEISGFAWSGRGRIRRVDVSTDGGASWHQADLQEPILPKCLTRFRLPWTWDSAPAQLQSRA